jgi:glutaminase
METVGVEPSGTAFNSLVQLETKEFQEILLTLVQ